MVLWMMSWFHTVELMGQNKRRHMFSPVSQVAAQGAKSAVSDSILLFICHVCEAVEQAFVSEMLFGTLMGRFFGFHCTKMG